MLLIFISWIYIVLTTINFGVLTDRILVLKNKNFAVTSFLGLFSVTILASIWAIFGRLNIEFHIALLLVNLSIYFKYRVLIIEVYTSFWISLKRLPTPLKIYLAIISILIIAQCSTIPYVIDNESYYIQTIKWLNEYGFVKGLINLHLFLGQTSGWHILQSAFNFSFLYENFNDLSGFALLLGIYFSVEKLNEYFKIKKFHFLLIGTLPLISIYFFPFISAPSPDIPIYILTFIMLFYFIDSFKSFRVQDFNLIVVLILFMLYIKSTSFIFILIPIVLFVKNYTLLKGNLTKSIIISGVILVLFVTKNMITCGSPVFPMHLFDFTTTNYTLPKTITDNIFSSLKYLNYEIGKTTYDSMSATDLFSRWLTLPKLTGVFNKISIILLFISPLFIYKFQNKQNYWIVYGLMVLQLTSLFATSPQYRFFMNFMLFFGLFCFVCFIRNQKTIRIFLFASTLPIAYLLFVGVKMESFTNNKLMSEQQIFSSNTLLFPLENTKFSTKFEEFQLGNLKYNSPNENDFLYGTGNGNLPCVNKKLIEYNRKKYNLIPQMRTKDLKDGFYSKKLSNNE